MIRFQHTEYLLALIAVPLMVLLYRFVIKWKKRTVKKIGDEQLVKQLINNYDPAKFSLKFLMIVGAFIVAVIGLANPRSEKGTTTITRSGIDVMIALDVSKSMLAQDTRPNRLEKSRQLITKLIDKLSNDRIGIVVFAGRAYLQMPLTADHAAAKMYLSATSTDMVPAQGTVIGDALKMSYAAFNTKEKKYRSVILISDGEDHDEGALKVTKALADEGVMINTIGIGSPEGAMIPDPSGDGYKRDADGNPVVTKLNESALREIAEKGNGIYLFFNNTDEVVTKINGQLKTMGQRSVTENSLLNYQNYFPWFLGMALILLMIEFFVTENKKETKKFRPAFSKTAAMTLCMFCITISALAQGENELIEKGNEAYKNEEFELAANNYKQVTVKDSANEKAGYNLGNALYKAGKKEEALKAYDEALQHSKLPMEKADIWYNKAVILQNNKKLTECIESYKNALRLNPTDEDARQNLQIALQQQKQQQQQEKDRQNKKPKEDQKQKNQQQQDKDKNEQPKPQPSKMTKQEAEEKLKALLQQEKNLQDKLRKVNAASPERPEKDW